jgi:hypothetical protein
MLLHVGSLNAAKLLLRDYGLSVATQNQLDAILLPAISLKIPLLFHGWRK